MVGMRASAAMRRVGSCCAVMAVAAVLSGINTATAHAAPLSEGLGRGSAIGDRIATGDCRMLLIGDSISSKNTNTPTQSSLFWGIIRTWHPTTFVGFTTPSNNQFPQTQLAVTQPIYATVTNRNLQSQPASARQFSYGYRRVASAPAVDFHWDRGLDQPASTLVLRIRLNENSGVWQGGDWFTQGPVRARHLVCATPYSVPSLAAQSQRISGPGFTAAPVDLSGQWRIAGLDTPTLPQAPGRADFSILTAGGHDESLAADHLIWLTTRIWLEGATGFSIDALAVGGARLADHLADGPFMADDLLAEYLALSGEPNVIAINLGANDGAFSTDWRDDMIELIDRYDALSTSTPDFVLIAPYGTLNSISHENALIAADFLHGIATTGTPRVDESRIAFVNLPGLLGGPIDQALLTDTIHPTPAGIDHLAALIWSRFVENDCPADISSVPAPGVPDGALTGADFFEFLDRFSAGDMRADYGSATDPIAPDGALTGSDFFCFLDLFSRGCN